MRNGCAWICVLLVAGLMAAAAPAEETFNRGLIAVANDAGQAYIGWRLLKADPPGVAFNVYRRTADGAPVKVNTRPISASTNLVDAASPDGQGEHLVCPRRG